MLPLVNFGTLPKGKFPNLCAIWPHFLGQVASRKERGVEANSLRRRKIGAQCFPWGTCKFREANEPKVHEPTWFALNNSGTMFVPKNLSPFAPGKHVSLGGLGPICLGKLCFHKELGPTYSQGTWAHLFKETMFLLEKYTMVLEERVSFLNAWKPSMMKISIAKICEPKTSHSKVETVNHLHTHLNL